MGRAITTSLICIAAVALFTGCDDSNVNNCTPTNGGVEACGDNIDNNCNGQIDEGCGTTCTPTNGGIEACNDGIDNDCDGAIDEGCTTGDCSDGQTQGCGGSPSSGACLMTCIGGRWGTCVGTPPLGGAQEICGDGIDNNCDEHIDEHCECTPGNTQACGASAPETICVETCAADGRWQPCAPNPPNTGVEACDGLDNDCDGTIDNGVDCTCENGTTQWCGGSPERHTCQQECTGGTWSDCGPVSGAVVDERCGDAEDNDCDGSIDEPEPCTSACGSGEARCDGTSRGDCVVAGVDCQPGDSDEQPCDGEDRGICDPGTQSRDCRSDCTWNPWGRCDGVVTARSETCNGEDDNCNGTIDDGATGTDSYGRNDEIGRCASLGEDPEEMDIYPIIDVYGTDWFCFVADDSSWNPLEDIDIVLTNAPGIDLDIILHFDDPETGVVTEMGRSERRGTMDEEIHFNDRAGTEDGGTWFIQVENYDEDAGGCYHLYVNGLR